MNNIKQNNIEGINEIIKYLEELKNSKDIEQYRITLKGDIYAKRDMTKRMVETQRNGERTIITIEKGLLMDTVVDHIGTKVLRDDTNYDFI